MSMTIGYVPGITEAWIWSGGDYVMNIAGVGQGVTVQGEKSNSFLNAAGHLPAFIRWRFEASVGVAAATGRELTLFMGQSDAGGLAINNPGGLTGSPGILANGFFLLGQCDRVGSLLLSASRTTNVQRVWLTSYPKSPFQIPVVYNDSGQTLSSFSSAHGLWSTPYYQTIETF
jgi:hypothetical protein